LKWTTNFLARGAGTSKKEAQQNASKVAVEKIKTLYPDTTPSE